LRFIIAVCVYIVIRQVICVMLSPVVPDIVIGTLVHTAALKAVHTAITIMCQNGFCWVPGDLQNLDVALCIALTHNAVPVAAAGRVAVHPNCVVVHIVL